MNDAYPVFGIAAGAVYAAYLIYGSVAVAALLYCIKIARREHQPWPLAIFIGSATMITYEPFNNFMAHLAYATGPNQHQMLTWFGQHVPWMTWLVYIVYTSTTVPLLVHWLDRGMTVKKFLMFYAGVVAGCAAFEPLFCNVHAGLHWWYYYGDNQPFDFTGLPMFWWFANATAMFGMGVIFHLLKKHVFTTKAQQWLFVPLSPLLTFAIHGSASAPVFTAIHSTDSKLLGSLATLASIGISLFYVWLMVKAACVTRPVSAAEHDAQFSRSLA